MGESARETFSEGRPCHKATAASSPTAPRSHERHAIGIGVGAGRAAPGRPGEPLRPRSEDRSDRVDAEREEDPTAAVQLGVGVPADIVELPCRVSEQVQEARAQKDATAKDCAEPDGAINPWAVETVPHHQRCAAANGGADENDRGVGDAVHIHVLWAVYTKHHNARCDAVHGLITTRRRGKIKNKKSNTHNTHNTSDWLFLTASHNNL